MRRVSTWLLVAAVVGVGAVAAADALRGGSSSVPAAARATTEATVSVEEDVPLEGGFSGVLYYTGDDCRLRALELPSSNETRAPSWGECRFSLAPRGRGVQSGSAVWDPDGNAWALASGRNVVLTSAPSTTVTFEGSAPAFRPDGTFTFVRDGAVRAFQGDCGRTSGSAIVLPARAIRTCSRVLVPARDIERALSDLPEVRGSRVQRLSWLDDRRAVAILEADLPRRQEQVIALFDGRNLLRAFPSGGTTYGRLWTSPQGSFFAVEGDTILLFDREGRSILEPPVGRVRAVAWAPDESWAALATDRDVYVFLTGTRNMRLRRLGIVAHDLAWRAAATPPALEAADEARAWLGGVGVTGRLFVTGVGCRLRALRIPDLAWEARPAGVRAPCRFALGPDDSALGDAVAVQPQSRLRALCEQDGIRVLDAQGLVARFPNACSPGWTPDGRLTFIRDGELFVVEPGNRERRLISRADLRTMFDRDAALEEVAWIDDAELWAVVRSGGSAVLATLTKDRLLFSPSFTARRIEGLEVSATGMVAARTERGVVFFDTGGRRALSFPGGRAVAWAPGELVAAVALQQEVLFVAPVSREIVPLPLAVADLEWVVP